MRLIKIIFPILILLILIPNASANYYVSLGDSYATGYQPTSQNEGKNTTNGFAYQIPKLAKKKGYNLKLMNFGCAGATSSSILNQKLKAGAKCLGPKAPKFNSTQIKAASDFIKANKINLITISIGGNDITACAKAPDPVICIVNVLPKVEKNLNTLLTKIRKASGSKVRIVGITYPNIILGDWVGKNANQELAKLSIIAFKDLINPMLAKTYKKYNVSFIDVTKETGAYIPLEQTVNSPYGIVPQAVNQVCNLTYYCNWRDIHPKTEGYKLIAQLITATLPKRK